MGEKKITIIPARTPYKDRKTEKTKALRVAAYCRVSTLLEHQESSYEAQVSYYTELISNHPEWKMAGIYADDGITATSTKHREQFNAMIEACKKGKIDMILTKSISRFARNTLDSLQYIRMLKERNIAIFFEKENINTLDTAGELLITILSSQAQEESRNISENVRWAIRRKYESGGVNGKRLMGYRQDTDGQMVIIPEEAETVRFIFKEYLDGESISGIARKLEERGILTLRGNKKWNTGVIQRMLENEKYMGDAMMQKTYTSDFLTKKRITNNGEMPHYYVENNHEAIISREMFYQAQEERLRRSSLRKGADNAKEEKSKHSGKYALTEIMVCKECGHPYRRQIWTKNGIKKAVWRCESRLKNGPKYCKNSPTLQESDIHRTILEAINAVLKNEEGFVMYFRESTISAMSSEVSKKKERDYDVEMQKVKKKLIRLMEENLSMGRAMEDYETEYKRISDQLEELRLEKIKSTQSGRAGQRSRGYGASATYDTIEVYDDVMTRKLIERIYVVNAEKLEIQFKSGITMTRTIELSA